MGLMAAELDLFGRYVANFTDLPGDRCTEQPIGETTRGIIDSEGLICSRIAVVPSPGDESLGRDADSAHAPWGDDPTFRASAQIADPSAEKASH